MEDTERTENNMVNLLVLGATVARWIRGRFELRVEDFREKSSKVGLKSKVSEKSAETEKRFREQFVSERKKVQKRHLEEQILFLQNLPRPAFCCATLSPIRASNHQKPSTEGKMEDTERTENTMVNLLVMGATVAR